MPDALYLSLWLRDHSTPAMPVYLRKSLSVFPFSILRPGAILRVHALSFNEAPNLEEYFDGGFEIRDLAAKAQEFLHEDSAFVAATHWELWQWDEEWKLAPAPVSIEVYGPDFDTDYGEHLRLDFSDERLFLPSVHSDQLRPVQSNIRSLLHLLHDLENELPVERRLLWSDNEEDFSARLQALLE